MSIDFSKAPKDATHYGELDGVLTWFKFVSEGLALPYWPTKGTWAAARVLAPLATPIRNFEDNVNSPTHYNTGSIECIDAINASMMPEAYRGYLKGNVLKYLWRYEKKANPVEDLKKAQWYLERLIEEQEGE